MKNQKTLMDGKIPCAETGIEVKKSICAICDPLTQCGLDVYVKDGTAIKVDGNEDHPYNRGTLCSKGAATRQYVYNEQRLKTPMRRTGPKGSGTFEPITWDEAMDEIAKKFNQIKKESGPEAVGFSAGYAKYFRPYLKRLAHSFGSPNYMTESSTCFQATAMAQNLVYGIPGGPDLMNSKCALIWSSNPFYTNLGNGKNMLKCLERGMKLIVVDPRKTPTVSKADIHLQLRPGTDGALALAMAHVIINEGLYDRDFVNHYTYGFDDYKQYVQEFTPDRGEELTGVPSNKIIAAARMYATAKPASIMPSASPVVHHTNGVQNYRAVFSLAGLTGNYDVKGGNFVTPMSFIHTGGLIVTREHEFIQPVPWSELPARIGIQRFPVWGDVNEEESQCMDLPRQIMEGTPYPVRGIIGFGLNYRMWPDSEGMRRSLEKLEFFVNTELFMTDTCKYADIILPACTSIERRELRCYPMGYIIFTQPAIKPMFDSRPDVDIIYDLASRLDLDDPLFKAGYEASVDWMLEPTGITVDELNKHPGGMFVPNPVDLPERKYINEGFKTPSGKLEFKSSVLEKYNEQTGFESLPYYHPPKYSHETDPERAKDYPLILNTGSRLPMYVHTRTYRMSWPNSLRPLNPAADINPEDAQKLGIAQADRIRVSTPEGSIEVNANITSIGNPGVVYIYHGFSSADVNTLFPANYLDPLSGFPGFKSALCKVEKI